MGRDPASGLGIPWTLDRLSDMLIRLEEGHFMDGLECLQEGAGTIRSSFRRLRQRQLSRRGEVADPLGEEQFLEALGRIGRSLHQLRPRRLCQLLDDALDSMAEKDDTLPTLGTLAQMQSILDELAAAHVFSRLRDLAQVLQEVRPPGGFHPESYHPSLAARLHKLYVLPVLALLEEVLDFMFSPTNVEELLWLQFFVHFQHTAPAA